MKRNNKTLYTAAFAGLLGFVLFSLLTGCQTMFNRYIGKTVPDPNRISIPEGKPQSGVWQTKDLSFQYTCLRKSGKLSLTGELALNESYEQFEILNYLYLWVHFLDSQGKIIDSKLALSLTSTVAYTGEKKQWSVKTSFELPVNATAVAFGYMGRVSQGGDEVPEDGGGGGSNWNFYKSPLT